MQQTADEILRQIREGFTGDTEKDIPYLQEKMETYRKHEQGEEILRECSRLLYDMSSGREEMKREQLMEVQKHMQEVRTYIAQGDRESALRLSEQLVMRADNNKFYNDNAACEYYFFSEFFEEIMVKEFMQTGREVIKADFPFADIYYQHGLLLMEQNNLSAARGVLEKARRWNPVSAPIAFAYMDIFRVTGEMEEYAELNRSIFPYLYKADDVAGCYCNFAGYFAEKQEWQAALACCQLSLQFAPDNTVAQSLMKELQNKTGKTAKMPAKKELERLAAKNGFACAPNGDIVNLAVGMGEQFMNRQMFDGALYCFEIVHGLTRDEKIGELVKQMKILVS